MRILSLNQQNSQGGAARIALGLVEGLNKKGMYSELWYFWEKGMIPNTNPLFSFFNNLCHNNYLDGKITRLLRKFRSYFGDVSNPFFRNAERKIRFWKPDILHLHNLHGGWVDLGITAVISKRIPTVLTLHDEWLITGHCAFSMDCLGWKEACSPCPYLDRYVPLKRDIARQLFEKKKVFLDELARQNGVLVSPSQWLKKRVMDSGLWHGREIVVIPNGIKLEDHPFDPVDKNELRSKFGLEKGGMIGIFIADGGSTNYFKGYDILRKACLALPENVNFTLLVAGDEISKPHVQKLGAIKEIRLGYLETEKLQDYLKASDFFFYPTKADNFSLAILEAMASGVLVVVSNVGGNSEIVTKETGIVVDSCDVLKWRDAIVEICQTKRNTQIMGRLAQERIVESFTYEIMLERYMNLYRTLINPDLDTIQGRR